MRVFIIGGGAREHALAWKIKQSPLVSEVFCAPGNGGIAEVASCVPIDPSNVVELADFAEKLSMDLTVVGPELPLTLGLADELARRNLKVFGPTKIASEIEGSKVYSKQFMKMYGVPTPAFHACSTMDEVKKALDERRQYPVFVKADGLCAGKGAIRADTREETEAIAEECLVKKRFGMAGERILIEDFVQGREVTFCVITDGKRLLPLASARDFKRAHDGDAGPNTGGMGSFSPAGILGSDTSARVLREVAYPTVQGLLKENRRFRGVLYAGVMLTEQGPVVLEYNARLGDPETQSILPRLNTDIVPVMMATVRGKLEGINLEWKKEVSLSVVVASGGYPGAQEIGKKIHGLDTAVQHENVVVFHAGTARDGNGLVTTGGRVLTVNATAPSMAKARDLVYETIERIRFDGMQYRTDIGAPEETDHTGEKSP